MDGLKNHSVKDSTSAAWSGILRAVKDERNVKLELCVGFLVVVAGLFLGITKSEWLILILTIFAVLSAEILNSAIEDVCNLLRDKLELEYEETKIIRDIAAGAVLLLSLGSVVVGLIIFLPYLISAV